MAAKTQLIQIRNRPRLRMVKDMNANNTLRAYRESPESVCVQIRMENKFANVSLSFDEAKAFAALIVAAVEDR